VQGRQHLLAAESHTEVALRHQVGQHKKDLKTSLTQIKEAAHQAKKGNASKASGATRAIQKKRRNPSPPGPHASAHRDSSAQKLGLMRSVLVRPSKSHPRHPVITHRPIWEKKRAVDPSLKTSGIPPTFAVITGRLHAAASTAAMENASRLEGIKKISIPKRSR